jgi:periplasmic protein TonB
LLVRAALDAVERWRYRPYYLNGEAVEVETFITVNFRKEAH